MLTITINGVEEVLEKSVTVQGLLHHLNLPDDKIAVEHNGEIIPRSTYSVTWLESGDNIEVVHFVGGG
ncbi:MAG: sulfur carrier protein ThiS [Parvularculales bacterium]